MAPIRIVSVMSGRHLGPTPKGDSTVTNIETPRAAPPELNHKQLKALAKASRPWYAKKRFWALGVVGVIIIAVAAGGGSSSKSPSKSQNGGVSTVSDNGSHPPQADVTLTKCATDSIGLADVEATILNHSSGRSNYLVQVNILDAAGNKIGEANGASNNIEAGQSSTEKLLGTANGTIASCKVTEVNRFASN
jgi:hypothetical protein